MSEQDIQQSESYQRAKKRVKELKDFYEHLSAYVMVIGILFVINLFTGISSPWFLVVAFFWGVFGLGIHAYTTFDPFKMRFDKAWEERKIRELMAEERGHKLKNDREDIRDLITEDGEIRLRNESGKANDYFE